MDEVLMKKRPTSLVLTEDERKRLNAICIKLNISMSRALVLGINFIHGLIMGEIGKEDSIKSAGLIFQPPIRKISKLRAVK